MAKRPPATKANTKAKTSPTEWIGGVRAVPAKVRDERGSHRPELALWVERPSGAVVAAQLARKVSLADALLEALARPLVGPPRRPSRLTVEDARAARAVAAVAGDLPIEIAPAPSPELDEIVAELAEKLAADDAEAAREPDYVDDDVTPALLAPFFAAAAALHRAAPWRIAGDEQLMRLDVPSLELDGGALAIVGETGDRRGLILFPSFEAQQQFVARDGEGVELVALEYERVAEVPPSWRALAPRSLRAFPVPVAVDSDGFSGPPGAFEVQLLTAAAEAVVAFMGAHADLFTAPWDGQIRDEAHTGPSGLATHLLAPHPEAVAAALASARRRPRRSGGRSVRRR